MLSRLSISSLCVSTLLFHLNAVIPNVPSGVSVQYQILSGSKVTVVGSTNVNEFSCISEKSIYDPHLEMISSSDGTTLQFKNGLLNVKTKSLDCGNEVMNFNLCKTMNDDEYPYITIELLEVESSDGSRLHIDSSAHLNARINLTLAGKKKLNTVSVHALKDANGVFHFTGEHKLSLKSYELKPPRAFFGLIYVNDEITVQFDLRVKAEGASTQ